jgi:hypothetical protein
MAAPMKLFCFLTASFASSTTAAASTNRVNGVEQQGKHNAFAVRKVPRMSEGETAEVSEETMRADGPPAIYDQKGANLALIEESHSKQSWLEKLLTQLVQKHDGNISIALTGDSTMEGLYQVLLHSSVPGFHIHFGRNDRCPEDKPENAFVLPENVTAIAFTYGLHLLHLHPARSCSGPPWIYPHHECGTYSQVVERAIKHFHTTRPRAQLFWRTTNSICPNMLKRKDLRDLAEAWHDPLQRSALIQSVKKDCHLKFNDTNPDRRIEDELLNRQSAKRQRDVSLRVIEQIGVPVNVMDGFMHTDNKCAICGKRKDGIHYPCVDWDIAIDFAEQLLKES